MIASRQKVGLQRIIVAAVLMGAVASASAQEVTPVPGQTKENPLHIQVVTPSSSPGPAKPEFLSAAGLVQYGIAFGVAAAVVSPRSLTESDGSHSQSSVGIAAMPYVVFLPGYWALGNVSKQYCATRSLAITEKAASRAAEAYAESLATQTRKRGAGESEEAWRKFVLDETGWDLNQLGRCTWSWGKWLTVPQRVVMNTAWGVYLGLPLSYEASYRLGIDEADPMGGAASRVLRTQTRGSFGIAFVPWQYITVLGGVTRAAAEIPMAENQKRFMAQWMWTVGIGGNLETIGALIRSAFK